MAKRRDKDAPLPFTYSAIYPNFEEFRQAEPYKAEKQLNGMRELAWMVVEYLEREGVTECPSA